MIAFKKITSSDLLNVYNLAKEIWYDNYSEMISQDQIDYMLNLMYKPEQIQNDLDHDFVWEYVLYNNEIVGYLSYVIKKDNRVFLSKIYLKSDYQGLGLGKASLNRIINYTKKYNCKAVYLTVNRNNKKGIRAYKNAQFKIIAEEDFDIGNGYIMDDYIFELKM